MAGTTGLEPATSDVTGASARLFFSAKYVLSQRVAVDSDRHDPTLKDPLSQTLLAQLLTHPEDTHWIDLREPQLGNISGGSRTCRTV